MNIGYDAKRAFMNRSGLGNYSRDTLRIMHEHRHEHRYFLFTPSADRSLFTPPPTDRMEVVVPASRLERRFPSWWRSMHLAPALRRHHIDIYHGLSNELPTDIRRSGSRAVVTIHDLIFLRYPKMYGLIDRNIYTLKFRRSVKQADLVIAISQQTKEDLMAYFSAEEHKIRVLYQGCSPQFYRVHREEEKNTLCEQYGIPRRFILAVGTVEERKNVLRLVGALRAASIHHPLLIVGRQTDYAQKVKEYVARHQMEQVYFIENIPFAELPLLYQMADLLVYPSLFEGFGIPIVEALVSGVPVITSREGCFREAGGPASSYVNPLDEEEMGQEIRRLLDDETARKKMTEEGKQYALRFSDENIAAGLSNAYQSIL